MDEFAHEMAVVEEQMAESDGLRALANPLEFDDKDSLPVVALLEDKTRTEEARKMVASGHYQFSGGNRKKNINNLHEAHEHHEIGPCSTGLPEAVLSEQVSAEQGPHCERPRHSLNLG